MKTKRGKGFTVKELLDLANESYADGIMDLSGYYDKDGEFKDHVGASADGLARFVVVELIETCDPKAKKEAQLITAVRAIEVAKEQLADLQDHLERCHDNL
jgi:hypothetical protein